MNRKEIAQQTLNILKEGSYEINSLKIDISSAHKDSIDNSILITPEEGEDILCSYEKKANHLVSYSHTVENISTVDSVQQLVKEKRESIGVLNFASAKNPGGGFINGAMAQEESIATSSGLYETLTAHEEYYKVNKAYKSMMYTDHAIYSPNVVFFRDGSFGLIEEPVTASVLTLPAVNMGQVIRKGEDVTKAEVVMKRRMKLALALFHKKGNKNLILGAYGCGVFRNDPYKVALWWKELLEQYFPDCFNNIFFAVLDRSAKQNCIGAFKKVFDN